MQLSRLLVKAVSPFLLPTALFLSSANFLPALSEHNVARGLSSATDLGEVSPDEEMNLTVHLKIPDPAAFDAAVEQRYDPASPNFQKWMTDADLKNYAPGAGAAAVVKQELQKHGL